MGALFVLFFIIGAAFGIPYDGLHRAIDDGLIPDQEAEPSDVLKVAVAAPESALAKTQEPLAAESRNLNDHSIESVEPNGDHQTFFPSFASLFEPRQQRLNFNNQEAAHSQRPNSYRSLLNYPLFGGYRSLDNFGKQNSPAPLVDASSGILGSGNFGVIKGGTFFGQSEGESSDYSDGFSSYYNSHGRPSVQLGYSANPRPNYSQDQFANFRDFADINTPSNSAYSHFVVVYANKNATVEDVNNETKKSLAEPKNIIETLKLLDQVEPLDTYKEPKLSKSKAKLAKTFLNKKSDQIKKWSPKTQHSNKHEMDEPLLALS